MALDEAGGGTVANGVYSAPQAPGTYHVVATSTADPASATVTLGGTLTFGALVTTSCGTFASR